MDLSLSKRREVSVARPERTVRMGVDRADRPHVVRLHVGADAGTRRVRFRTRDDEHIGYHLPVPVEVELPGVVRAEEPHVLVGVALLARLEDELHGLPGDPEEFVRAEQSHTRAEVPSPHMDSGPRRRPRRSAGNAAGATLPSAPETRENKL